MLLRAIRKETEGDTSLAPLRAKTLSCGVSTLWNLHHKIEASRRGRSNAVVPCISLLSVPCVYRQEDIGSVVSRSLLYVARLQKERKGGDVCEQGRKTIRQRDTSILIGRVIPWVSIGRWQGLISVYRKDSIHVIISLWLYSFANSRQPCTFQGQFTSLLVSHFKTSR